MYKCLIIERILILYVRYNDILRGSYVCRFLNSKELRM